jgi:hypothetical protein
MMHLPRVHSFPVAQSLPHVAQFSGSSWRFASQPLPALPSQSSYPPVQTHRPPLHPWLPPHAPHDPPQPSLPHSFPPQSGAQLLHWAFVQPCGQVMSLGGYVHDPAGQLPTAG